MFGLELPEFVVILILVLVVFGMGKLPEIGRRTLLKARSHEPPH